MSEDSLEETTYDLEDKPIDYSYEYYPAYLFNFKHFRLNREEFDKLSVGKLGVKF